MRSSAWFVRRPGGVRGFRLYCFSHAGGSAVGFMPWQALLPAGVEVCAVQLPGRGTRLGEAPFTDLSALIPALAQAVGHEDDTPFAFFGHSLGALVAFELSRHLARHGRRTPAHLFVSGSDAPRSRRPGRELHRLPDDELIDVLRRYNGTPEEILANRELMALALPTLRADFALVETYRYGASPPLALPLTVLQGRADGHVTPEGAQAWAGETTGPCDVEWFDGDHFFIQSDQRRVVALIGDRLAQTARAGQADTPSRDALDRPSRSSGAMTMENI